VTESNFETDLAVFDAPQNVKKALLDLSLGRMNLENAKEAVQDWVDAPETTDVQINTLDAWWDLATDRRKAVLNAEEQETRNSDDENQTRRSDINSDDNGNDRVNKERNDGNDTRSPQRNRDSDDEMNNHHRDERMSRTTRRDVSIDRNDDRHSKRRTERKKSRKDDKRTRKSRDSSPCDRNDSESASSSESDSDDSDDNPNTRIPIIFRSTRDIRKGNALNRSGRRLQRKQQKIYFTAKTSRFQTTYQLGIKLPPGMSFSGALLILTQGRFPLQCFRTQEDLDPSGRKYSKVVDQVKKYATAFDNLSDWCLAQATFPETLVEMNPFEETGLVRYGNHALAKYNEILNAHQMVANGKNLSFQKFLIFETEVRKRVEDNDDYEWGDKEVWEEVARKKFPNVRDIATSTPFRPTEAWIQEDGSSIAIDSARGKWIGTVHQFTSHSGYNFSVRDVQSDGFDQGRYGGFPRGGMMNNRGAKQNVRGGYKARTTGSITYQNTSTSTSANNPGSKAPCEYFNKGHCTKTSDQCKFGHYCAQYRTNVGDGCGPRNAHSYSTHGGANTQESTSSNGATDAKP